MAKKKKKNRRAARVVTGEVVEVRTPGKRKRSVKRPRKKTTRKKKESKDVTALITKGADVGELVAAKAKDRDDLTAWFNVYMSVEIEPGSNTYRAKLGDIQWFLRFFYETTSGYECDQWTRSL